MNNERELRVLRLAAEIVSEDGAYMLEADGRVIMFGLTKARAEEYARYYNNPTITERTSKWGGVK